MTNSNLIVLITDFGASSPYVAEMKGAILSVNRDAQIVDGTHTVPAQNVLHAAFVTKQLALAFPIGTSFVVVVDPGVGTNRKILLVEYRHRTFVAPDNGVLSLLLDESHVRVLDQPQYWAAEVSSTFHGRDMMGPVVGHLSQGVSKSDVASKFDGAKRLDLPRIDQGQSEITGQVVFVDSFGNLITNLPRELLTKQGVVEYASHTMPIVATYGDAALSTPVALIGSSELLEIAVTNGDAREYFTANIGDSVRFRWQ